MPIDVDSKARVPGYQLAEGPAVAYRAGLTAADPVDITDGANLALPVFKHGGFQNLSVHVRFETALATVVVQCLRYAQDGTFLSSSEASFTAGPLREGVAGRFLSTQTVAFDTQGAPNSRLLIELPSAGEVDLFAESF